MHDLIAEMEALALRLRPVQGRQGMAVQFVAQNRGDGVSTLARAFAVAAARMAPRGVWLVDLNLFDSDHLRAFAAEEDVLGPLGRAVQASPDGSCFFNLSPKGRWQASDLLVGHGVGRARLWITRFRQELLEPGQDVVFAKTDSYWQALRSQVDWIVVDAPALDRAAHALRVARFMDTNLPVIDARQLDLASDRALVASLQQAGGRVAGAVLNRSARHLLEPISKSS